MLSRERPTLARRGFLSGLATLPLIGSGVMLIGKPAAAIPLADIAAAPLEDDPMQRARYAWEAFAAAMRDVTAGSPGWNVQGGEIVRTTGYMRTRAPWVNANAIDFVPIERSRGGLADRLTPITL